MPLSWARLIQPTPFFKICFNSVLTSISMSSKWYLAHSSSPPNPRICNAFLFSLIRATCASPSHFNLFRQSNVWWGVLSWASSSCIFLRFSVKAQISSQTVYKQDIQKIWCPSFSALDSGTDANISMERIPYTFRVKGSINWAPHGRLVSVAWGSDGGKVKIAVLRDVIPYSLAVPHEAYYIVPHHRKPWSQHSLSYLSW